MIDDILYKISQLNPRHMSDPLSRIGACKSALNAITMNYSQ